VADKPAGNLYFKAGDVCFPAFYNDKIYGDKMGLRNMYLLSEGHKTRLRKQLIAGARNYNKYLVNKTFKIICDDGTEMCLWYY